MDPRKHKQNERTNPKLKQGADVFSWENTNSTKIDKTVQTRSRWKFCNLVKAAGMHFFTESEQMFNDELNSSNVCTLKF